MKTFEEIYAENYTKLYHVAIRMVGDKDNASDILQEVFVSLYERFNEGTAVLYINTWLYRATLNKCCDYINRQKRYLPLETIPERLAENENLENLEKKTVVRQALAKLKPKERAMLLLYSEGFSYKEIAESTDIRFSSVGKTLSRALEKMENQLKAQQYDMY